MIQREKTWRLFAAALAGWCLFSGWAATASAQDAPEKVRIGVSTALTGEAATWGLDIQAVLRFANRKLARDKYDLVFEDDRCTAKDATTAAHKLVQIEKVPYVIGFACSNTILSAAGIYQQARVPVMVVSASSPRISTLGHGVFRSFPSDAGAAKRLCEHIKMKGLHSLAILSRQTDYSQDFRESFQKSCPPAAIAQPSEDYLPDDQDYRSALTLLRSKKPQGLFINSGWEEDFVRALKQARQIGWDVPVYGAYFPGSPALLKLAGKDAEGIEFVDTPPVTEVLTPEGRTLYAEFTAEFGELRSNQALFLSTFEGFRALSQAIESGADVAEFLGTQKFSGIFGGYRFDAQGDITGIPFQIKKIQNGKPAPYQP